MASLFTLILFFHVGAMAEGNSNATTVVAGFKTKAACEAAGKEAKKLVSGTVKALEFGCVEVK
jgi:hypothetical protein